MLGQCSANLTEQLDNIEWPVRLTNAYTESIFGKCPAVRNIGISILFYITYAYLHCLESLLVALDSAFIGLYRFKIIE